MKQKEINLRCSLRFAGTHFFRLQRADNVHISDAPDQVSITVQDHVAYRGPARFEVHQAISAHTHPARLVDE